MAHSLRSVGSAALNFALVAQGALDTYWEIGCWPWDVCVGIHANVSSVGLTYVQAAAVIAQEAGCFVTGGKNSAHGGAMDEAVLSGRKYLVVRAVADSAVRRAGFATSRD
jgi:myo-inositol-1(or 4)-monophosphatase